MKVKVGSVWKFATLDQETRHEVVAVGRGQYGDIKYRTLGTAEEPTTRKRKEFLELFQPSE